MGVLNVILPVCTSYFLFVLYFSTTVNFLQKQSHQWHFWVSIDSFGWSYGCALLQLQKWSIKISFVRVACYHLLHLVALAFVHFCLLGRQHCNGKRKWDLDRKVATQQKIFILHWCVYGNNVNCCATRSSHRSF